MTAGIALLIGGVAIALLGTTEWPFRGALGLNGVGWNFLFVGATTLLTTTYRPAGISASAITGCARTARPRSRTTPTPC